MFCENSKEVFINYSKFHGVCYNHSLTYERLYKCTHCQSIIPILPQSCSKCLSSNIFPVISSEISICFTCNSVPAPTPFQCAYCLNYEDVYKAPRCEHLICFQCFNQNLERCPICEIVFCEICHDKIDKLAIESTNLVCNVCAYNNAKNNPSELIQEFDKEACNKCFDLFEKLYELPSQQKVCEKCFKNNEIEEIAEKIELNNEEIILESNQSEESISLKEEEDLNKIEPYRQISQNSGIAIINPEKSFIKERKIPDAGTNHKKLKEVNAEINNTSIDITEINPLISKECQKQNEEKNCTFWTIFFLLIIFYLSTLCFCFSCFCNFCQGFKTQKKSSKSLYLFCICNSKSLTRKLWTSIVKCEYFSDNKES